MIILFPVLRREQIQSSLVSPRMTSESPASFGPGLFRASSVWADATKQEQGRLEMRHARKIIINSSFVLINLLM